VGTAINSNRTAMATARELTASCHNLIAGGLAANETIG